MRIWMRRFFFPSHYHVCVHDAHVEITFNWAMRVFMLWSNAAERRVYFARWGCEAPVNWLGLHPSLASGSATTILTQDLWSRRVRCVWSPSAGQSSTGQCEASSAAPVLVQQRKRTTGTKTLQPFPLTFELIHPCRPTDRAAIRFETWREKGELSNETAWRLRSGKKIRPLCCYWSGNCCRKRRFCSYFSMDGDAATSKQIYTSLKSVSKIWITC